MKLIIAIVRPFVIDRLVVAFEEIEGFPGVTITDTEGFGQRIKTPDDAINPLKANKRVEIVAPNELLEPIVTAIKEQAHTGRKGDGLVTVVDVESSTLI
ncbi:MAG: P-II family nitrogen regulator [Pyrinomonadaceae bacterium]|nr:P-II family nitrogen regulator [Pyrinomonadaceae bacterium]